METFDTTQIVAPQCSARLRAAHGRSSSAITRKSVVFAAAAALFGAISLSATPRAAMAQGAQAPTASQSAGVICKDGTTWAKPGRGACRGHGGVDKARTKAAAAAPGDHANSAGTGSAAPEAAAGGGQVWVNTTSKVYHCPGTRWYGKTKHGKYMSESAARAAGDRPDHGKSCS